MSTSRFFRAARGLALASFGGGVLAAAQPGCGGASATSLCQQICDCTGCDATQRQACEAGFNDSQTLASDKSCTGEFNAYEGCVADHLQCVGNTIDTTACSPESTALDSCTGGTTMHPGGSTVSCDVTSGGVHVCELLVDATAAQVMSATSSCTQESGTVGTSCPTAGALGTCKVTQSGMTGSITYYAGGGLTAANAEMACTGSGGTWTAG